MAYSEEQKDKILNEIFSIIESGKALRNAIKDVQISGETFYRWIEEDEAKSKQYARACDKRADAIFEDILDICDDSSRDKKVNSNGDEVLDSEFVQRSKLRVDARKWILSKLSPKKYGDKIQTEHSGEVKIEQITGFNVTNN